MSATPPSPPYTLVGYPGPGLATIVDRRAQTPRLWARTLGRRGSPLGTKERRCANCGIALPGAFYKPPPYPRNVDRLCVACVEGTPCGLKARLPALACPEHGVRTGVVREWCTSRAQVGCFSAIAVVRRT